MEDTIKKIQQKVIAVRSFLISCGISSESKILWRIL